MKRIFGAVVGLGVIIGGLYGLSQLGSTTTAENEPQETATSTIAVVEPTPAEMLEAATQVMIDQAIEDASEQIEEAANSAANDVRTQMELQIEQDVRGKIQAENALRIEQIKKETGAH